MDIAVIGLACRFPGAPDHRAFWRNLTERGASITEVPSDRWDWRDFLDLRGPSIPIDTACSSSLNAIHSAIQAIEYGDCAVALTGGINLLMEPPRHLSASMGMLSPTGARRTSFSSSRWTAPAPGPSAAHHRRN